MMKNFLPAPKYSSTNTKKEKEENVKEKKIEAKKYPKYGERKNFIPKTAEDFEDGGAYPEIHITQYPLGMGKKDLRSENTLAIQTDEEGNVLYDQIIKQNMAEDKIVYSTFSDLIEADVEDEDLSKPSEEVLKQTMQKTLQAIEDKCELKINSIKNLEGLGEKKKEEESLFIKYTPSEHQLKETKLKGTKERIIKIVESTIDPLEPPQFKHKKIPKGPPSPPGKSNF
jgi:SNW domain-containing protein 1